MHNTDWYQHLYDLLTSPILSIGPSQLTLGKIIIVALFVGLTFLIIGLFDRAFKRLGHQGRYATLSESGIYALSRLTRYVVWTAVVFAALNYLGIGFSHLALVGGAIGVGIGLGLQNLFSNFVSGIVLLLEQTLKVGDFVDLQSGVVGKVSEISIRYTRITTNDSVDVIVPNSEFINGRVTNWTFNDRFRRIHVPFGVAYGSDKEQVKAAGLAAAHAVAGTVINEKHVAEVWLVGFGDSSLNFELVVWVGPALAFSPNRAQALFLWEIETELAKRNLEIPFPQRDLHIRSGVLQVEHHEKVSEQKPQL